MTRWEHQVVSGYNLERDRTAITGKAVGKCAEDPYFAGVLR